MDDEQTERERRLAHAWDRATPPEGHLDPALSDVMPEARSVSATVSMDLAADVVSTINEWIGHMGSDVGSAGYEYNLVRRSRFLAQRLQACIIAGAIDAERRPTLAFEAGA